MEGLGFGFAIDVAVSVAISIAATVSLQASHPKALAETNAGFRNTRHAEVALAFSPHLSCNLGRRMRLMHDPGTLHRIHNVSFEAIKAWPPQHGRTLCW